MFPVFTLLLLLLTLLFAAPVLSETEVEGEVSGVWDVDGSPYLVLDTLIVPEGDTLLIEPGVTVEFQDQDSTNQYPFFVHGTLLAHGTEADSIFFLSEGWTFPGFVSANDADAMRVSFRYCCFDSVSTLLDLQHPTSIAIKHSRIHTTGMVYSSVLSADTVTHCAFQCPGTANMNSTWGGPYLFTDNVGNVGVFLDALGDSVLISNNAIDHVTLLTAQARVFGNQLDHYTQTEGSVEFYQNQIDNRTNISNTSVIMHDNLLDGVDIEACNPVQCYANVIERTVGTYGIDATNSVGSIHHNVVTADGTPIFAAGIFADMEVYHNTLMFGGVGLVMRNGAEAVNNIFYGTGDNAIAIQVGDPSLFQDGVRYNAFHNLQQIVQNGDGDEVDSTNQEMNPQLAGGEPFDYHLQANSSCIDAGDPDSPQDPDSTQADIGCYFYDQSIDNPPVQTIPGEIFAQTGTLLRIQITATDDNGPFSFTFPDLPDWLSEEDELDWVSDTTAVSGTVPEDAEDVTFTVIVEDGPGQTDTAEVFVDVDQRTLLSGEISGTLHAEDSPFYVVEDIVVPEGDSLVIEPGCELQFRYVEDEEQRIGLDVYGKLTAEGSRPEVWWKLSSTVRVVEYQAASR